MKPVDGEGLAQGAARDEDQENAHDVQRPDQEHAEGQPETLVEEPAVDDGGEGCPNDDECRQAVYPGAG